MFRGASLYVAVGDIKLFTFVSNKLLPRVVWKGDIRPQNRPLRLQCKLEGVFAPLLLKYRLTLRDISGFCQGIIKH